MKQIGRYEIVGRLGRGGMSTIYKAKAPVTGRIVALKVLDPREQLFVDLAGEERLRQIFLEEARIMGAISHAHVAKVVDCDEDRGLPFIVLEYFAHSLGDFIGESYRVERPSREISVAKTSYYLMQTLKGLERLHFSGIVHRDIKPFNLMITNDDRIKIIDFGLSRVRGEERMKIPGLQVGTPFYAAPEQEAHPEQADERADVYSVGMLAYRMLTGHLAIPAQGCVSPPSSFRRDLTPAWDQLIMRSLAVDLKERFASARQMRTEMEEVFADWRNASVAACRNDAGDHGIVVSPSPARTAPQRIMLRDVRQDLGLDELMRPGEYHRHSLQAIGAELVRDLRTGLLWQGRGAEFPLDWVEAGEYVDHLNRRQWQGRGDWRLPTMAELLTILRPPTVDRDFCLPPVFSGEIQWLWSSDWCSKRQAWMVDIVECYAGRLDKDGAASVCAVATLDPKM
jgi:serine/threonine-protein kinase